MCFTTFIYFEVIWFVRCAFGFVSPQIVFVSIEVPPFAFMFRHLNKAWSELFGSIDQLVRVHLIICVVIADGGASDADLVGRGGDGSSRLRRQYSIQAQGQGAYSIAQWFNYEYLQERQ